MSNQNFHITLRRILNLNDGVEKCLKLIEDEILTGNE